MIELEDCGKDTLLTFQGITVRHTSVRVQMVIKAPKGQCSIFYQPQNEYSKQLRQTYADSQCEAIKAFMEEHKWE